jgi:hypothetical protein
MLPKRLFSHSFRIHCRWALSVGDASVGDAVRRLDRSADVPSSPWMSSHVTRHTSHHVFRRDSGSARFLMSTSLSEAASP